GPISGGAGGGSCGRGDWGCDETRPSEGGPRDGTRERAGLPHADSRPTNLPRSVFLNRAAFPLGLSSRRMPAYRVAAGVLPPGLVQYFFAAIASISSPHDIGLPSSANTRAAASSAVMRFGFSGSFVVVVVAVSFALRTLFFFAAMIHL